MKLYTYLVFFLGVLIATGYVCAAPLAIKKNEYTFTLENKIRANKSTIPLKIYGVVYEKLGVSKTPRWKRVKPPFSLDFNEPYTLSLSPSNNYAYALGASDVMFDQEFISDQEKKALEAKDITATMHKVITSLDFSLKNPLEVGVISLTNDYAYPIFVARYVFDTSKKGLNVELASTIKRCNSKQTIDIVVPIGYKGSDVVLLASRTIDTLAASLDISKGAFLISRSSFENIKKDTTKNSYDASRLFAENTLTIVNDTTRDWVIGIYGKKGAGLQLLSEQKRCPAGKKTYCNKNFFSPVSEYDYSSLLWVLFDADDKKIGPTVSLNSTMHGGSVARETQLVHLSKWFIEPKKDILEPTKETEQQESSDKAQFVQQDEQKVMDENVNKDTSLVTQKESVLQEAINGTYSCSLKNITSKDIFVAMYTQEKDLFQRREKPVKIPTESALPIGFEEKERLAFSVSHLELKETLSFFEWNNLNSIVPQEYKERECKIEQSNFKKAGSFELAEITLKNDSYVDLAVGRYEYKKRASGGVLALCGVVQSVAKKSFDAPDVTDSKSDDAVKIVSEKPNFALPQGYKGFLGYKNASDEKNFSSDLPTSIDTVLEFGMTHLGRIDSSDVMTFDVEKNLTGKNLLTVENDLGQGKKWVGLRGLDDRIIRSSLEILPGKKGEFIPYQEQMKLVVAERNFDASIRPQVPYGEILVNTVERLSYALSEAEMVTTDPDSVRNAQKERALKIAALLKQKQQQAEQQRDKKIETVQKGKKQKGKITGPEEQKQVKTTQSKWKKFSGKKPARQSIKPKEILKEGACGPNQIRIMNYSGGNIAFRFYYRGFFSTTPVPNPQTYGMSNGQELCFDLPASAYLNDRYVVVDQDFVGLKESYSKQEVVGLMRGGRAFNLEKEKNVTIKRIDDENNKK